MCSSFWIKLVCVGFLGWTTLFWKRCRLYGPKVPGVCQCIWSKSETASKSTFSQIWLPTLWGDGANWVKNGYQLLNTNWKEIKSMTNCANPLFTCPNESGLVSWLLLDIFENFIWLSQMCESLPQTKKSSSWSIAIKWRAVSISLLLLASVYVDAAFLWNWNRPIDTCWLLESCNISQLSSVNDKHRQKFIQTKGSIQIDIIQIRWYKLKYTNLLKEPRGGT